MLDRGHEIETAAAVEAEHDTPVAAHPEGVLELVAIARPLTRRHDRLERWRPKAAEPFEGVAHLQLLPVQLGLVAKRKPRRAGMVDGGRDTVAARLEQLDDLGLGVGAATTGDAHAHAIARKAAAHEQHEAAATEARHARAPVGERRHFDVELLPAPRQTRTTVADGCPCRGRDGPVTVGDRFAAALAHSPHGRRARRNPAAARAQIRSRRCRRTNQAKRRRATSSPAAN
ncbi:hypothetical protein HRbin41_00069 [bacterium HR41]|nr:hypothetical protein HRbin41_00069 [bacterium HR41]